MLVVGNERKITIILFSVYMIVVTWIIMFKMQTSYNSLEYVRSINLIPFGAPMITNGKVRPEEMIGNVLVFIPIGVFISMLKSKWPFIKRIIPIFTLSLIYEAAQYIFHIGVSDVTDLITNTFGGVIGILIAMLSFKLLKMKAMTVLSAIASVCMVGLLSLVLVMIR